eukprot:4488108-Amphidinium_carterae.1
MPISNTAAFGPTCQQRTTFVEKSSLATHTHTHTHTHTLGLGRGGWGGCKDDLNDEMRTANKKTCARREQKLSCFPSSTRSSLNHISEAYRNRARRTTPPQENTTKNIK